MPLRRDPLQELLDLQERMNRLFEETLARERVEEPALLHGTWTPLADVLETPEAYLVELELPGLSRDDVVVHHAPSSSRASSARTKRSTTCRRRTGKILAFGYIQQPDTPD